MNKSEVFVSMLLTYVLFSSAHLLILKMPFALTLLKMDQSTITILGSWAEVTFIIASFSISILCLRRVGTQLIANQSEATSSDHEASRKLVLSSMMLLLLLGIYQFFVFSNFNEIVAFK